MVERFVEWCFLVKRLVVECLVRQRVAGIEPAWFGAWLELAVAVPVVAGGLPFRVMQTIGLIGGMSWESTAEYYRIINERVKDRLGGLHSARIALYSVDFAEIEELQQQGDWSRASVVMVEAAQRVKAGGADFIVICTNTMHRMADDIQQQTGLPVLHIADATARAVVGAGITTVGLLGTRYTMEQDFYRGRLETNHGLRVLVPDGEDRSFVHDVIYDELCLGITRDDSRRRYLDIVHQLEQRGAGAVILGCTEIGLLIGSDDTDTSLFDTTRIHAEAAADTALDCG